MIFCNSIFNNFQKRLTRIYFIRIILICPKYTEYLIICKCQKKKKKISNSQKSLIHRFFFFGIQVNGVNDRAINVKITIRRRIPITIGHDVNCDDHATGARTMWGNRVIVRERQREKQREKEERMARAQGSPHLLLDPRCRI